MPINIDDTRTLLQAIERTNPPTTTLIDTFFPAVKTFLTNTVDMFNWHAQTFIQSYWSKVDNPMNKRLIDLVVDSENIRINGFVSRGFLLGGRIEYLKEENPTTDQMDGIVRFHTYFTPPVPARVIENTIEFDTSYLETLFG